jgi:hypothetical protein
MPESIHKYHFPKNQFQIQMAAFINLNQSPPNRSNFLSWKMLASNASNRDCVVLRLLLIHILENIQCNSNVNLIE